MRKSYSPEFKAKVMREVLKEEKTLSQIAATHGVHPNQVAQWRDQALAGLAGIFSNEQAADWQAKSVAYEQEKQDLYAEIGRLTTQLTWLKKSGKHAESPRAASDDRPGQAGRAAEVLQMKRVDNSAALDTHLLLAC